MNGRLWSHNKIIPQLSLIKAGKQVKPYIHAFIYLQVYTHILREVCTYVNTHTGSDICIYLEIQTYIKDRCKHIQTA